MRLRAAFKVVTPAIDESNKGLAEREHQGKRQLCSRIERLLRRKLNQSDNSNRISTEVEEGKKKNASNDRKKGRPGSAQSSIEHLIISLKSACDFANVAAAAADAVFCHGAEPTASLQMYWMS